MSRREWKHLETTAVWSLVQGGMGIATMLQAAVGKEKSETLEEWRERGRAEKRKRPISLHKNAPFSKSCYNMFNKQSQTTWCHPLSLRIGCTADHPLPLKN
jgi:hypothetical protein